MCVLVFIVLSEIPIIYSINIEMCPLGLSVIPEKLSTSQSGTGNMNIIIMII